ncbi:hypothetical protein BG004_001861 [Podila humilis]|nr:hypothetical protein BG004_001861 [Podila humilis]
MESQLVPFAIMLGSMQITKRLNLQDQTTKNRILGGYVAAQTLILAIQYLIRHRILKRKDNTLLTFLEEPPSFSFLPVAQQTKTTGRRQNEQQKLIKTTYMVYDLEQVNQAQRQTLLTMAVMVFLHFKFRLVRPLLVQSLLPLRNTLAAKVAQVHLFGRPAKGPLTRPWKAQSPFTAFLPDNHHHQDTPNEP